MSLKDYLHNDQAQEHSEVFICSFQYILHYL